MFHQNMFMERLLIFDIQSHNIEKNILRTTFSQRLHDVFFLMNVRENVLEQLYGNVLMISFVLEEHSEKGFYNL